MKINHKNKLIASSLVMAITMSLSSQVALAQETYTVVANDTLYSIANRFGVSVPDLMEWNNIQNGTIYIGSELIVKNENTEPKIPAVQEDVSQETTTQEEITTETSVSVTSTNANENNLQTAQESNNNVTSVNNTNTTTYTVKQGDYLYKIATEFGITVQNLRDWNNLSNNYIYVGDVLKVSKPVVIETPVTKPSETTQTTPTTPKPSATTYTVKRGDYLHKIATQYGVTVQNLVDWNNLTSNYIYVGDVLKVSKPTVTKEETSKPAPTPTPSPSTSIKTYTVKRGDYLHKIATQYGVTVQNLVDWNNLSNNYIYVGDVLKVSKPVTETSSPKPTETTQPTPTTPKPSATTYTVKRGDYLHKIATQFGVTVQNLVDWNNLTSNYIYVGDVLKVSKPTVTQEETTKPTPSPTPSPSTSTKTYTVKRGDYLHKIATQYGVTVKNLVDWNNLTSNYIYVGDVLNVSKPTVTQEETTTPAPTPTPSPTIGVKTYTVKSGDYLYKIANQHGVTVDQLRKWNNMTNNYVYVGDVLTVSQPSSSTTNPKPVQNTIPDLSLAQPIAVNYDVKLNSTNAPLRTTRTLTGSNRNAVAYFGQRFNVLREFKVNNQTYMELINSAGSIVGYVPKSAGVEVPQGVNTVYIDAGHGGSETGASNYGVHEKNLNLNITRQLAQRLRDLGYHVYESRTTDKTIPLYERTFEPNRLMPDAYISVHHNAMPISGTAQGIVTLYHDPVIDEPDYMTVPHHYGTNIIPEGKHLSAAIQNALIRATGAVNQGIRPQNLHVTRKTDVPATLVELGFMDHWGEHQKLITSSYQQKLINGLVNGINAYFGKTR